MLPRSGKLTIQKYLLKYPKIDRALFKSRQTLTESEIFPEFMKCFGMLMNWKSLTYTSSIPENENPVQENQNPKKLNVIDHAQTINF